MSKKSIESGPFELRPGKTTKPPVVIDLDAVASLIDLAEGELRDRFPDIFREGDYFPPSSRPANRRISQTDPQTDQDPMGPQTDIAERRNN